MGFSRVISIREEFGGEIQEGVYSYLNKSTGSALADLIV
jgi:hypothetical protein